MAATIGFLKLPAHLPHKPNYCISKLQPQPPSSKPNTPNQHNPTPPPLKLITTTLQSLKSASLPLTSLTLPFFFDAKARCIGCGWGVWDIGGKDVCVDTPGCDGRVVRLHIVGRVLGLAMETGRTIQDEINELKKQEKPAPVTPDGTPIEAPPSPVSLQIKQLTEERKQLVKGGYRDRHFNAGSILLGFGVLEAIGGGVNTYLRTGKLFPGPHLYAGAGITVLWALAAALVPAMQKGNETARSLHNALNVINVLLFIWQIPTGLDIVWKVFKFTKWP